MRNTRRGRQLEEANLDNDRTRFHDEETTNDRHDDFMLGGNGTDPIKPPSASEPVSPIKMAAGGALNQRKPSPRPQSQPKDDRKFPVPGTKLICR